MHFNHCFKNIFIYPPKQTYIHTFQPSNYALKVPVNSSPEDAKNKELLNLMLAATTTTNSAYSFYLHL